MSGGYNHAQEPRIVREWLRSGLFRADGSDSGAATYSTPNSPPNVTGALHMGHALNASLRDTLVRYHRLRGKRTTWVFGTDHAGIATQTQVEKQVRREGSSRQRMGRGPFEQRVWRWCEEYGDIITRQFQRIGASADYSAPHFTLDEGYSRAVLTTFVRLFEKGCIYRDNYLVNWDPGSGSAISNFEVENREVVDELHTIAYPLLGGGEIEIATVRPETILGDTAIAVHPENPRYRNLVGRRAICPVRGRELPIVADEVVDPEMGTGAVKVCPAHDPVDFQIADRHGLPAEGVIGEDGLIVVDAEGGLGGLSVKVARREVLARLRAHGALRGVTRYTHSVPFSHRSGARIEPLVSLQWFLRLDSLAPAAIEAIEEGRVRIRPEPWQQICLNWMREPTRWCISRQLWWGHRLPVWYRGEETFVGLEAPEGEGWERDPDVLDTWFSATPWPFAIFGWPEQTPELRDFYPTDVMLTARDIVLMWFPQMIMFGLEFAGDVPFRNVYVHSIIQAPDGRRMSKSLGTGVDPIDEIERHGADAVRFGLLTMSTAQDVRYSSTKIEQGRRFINKLWNASRFILGNVGEGGASVPSPSALEDRWIRSRLAAARAEFEADIEAYEFAAAAECLYRFVRGDLCSYYLEFVKGRIAAGPEPELGATLLDILVETLLLAHPIAPFVTEEIWSNLPGERGLCAGSRLGAPPEADPQAERDMQAVIDTVKAIRSWRKIAGVQDGSAVLGALETELDQRRRALIARGANIHFDSQVESGDGWTSFSTPVGVLRIQSGVVQAGTSEEAVAARRSRLESQILRRTSQLSNQSFLSQAPAHAVEAERKRLKRQQAELARLK